MFQRNEVVAVPLSLSLYRELLDRFPDKPHTVIENVVADFLERTADDVPRAMGKRGTGVMWEALFLPEKTRLRTKHLGEYKYAEVKGNSVQFGGEQHLSVAQATNRMRGGTQNNAWRVVEVLLPGNDSWVRAEQLRRR